MENSCATAAWSRATLFSIEKRTLFQTFGRSTRPIYAEFLSRYEEDLRLYGGVEAFAAKPGRAGELLYSVHAALGEL